MAQINFLEINQKRSAEGYAMPADKFFDEQRIKYEGIKNMFAELEKKASSQKFQTPYGDMMAKDSVASFKKQVDDFASRLETLSKSDSKSNRYYFVDGDGDGLLIGIESSMNSLNYL